MTKSTITRERLQEIAEDGFLKHGESKELARMALAAMDSGPVAEVLSNRPGNDTSTIDSALPVGTQLYLQAQPDAIHLSYICAESYQVVGALAEAIGIFNDVGVIKALDNLSAQEIIHDDVLPFSVPEAAQPATVLLAIPDEMTSEKAYEIGDYHGDPVDVFVRGANWMRQHVIDSTLASAPQEGKP